MNSIKNVLETNLMNGASEGAGLSHSEQEERNLRKLLSPGIRLILIKGRPGAGKTTLVTRLLDFVNSGTYISSRVGLEKLSKQNSRLARLELEGRFNQLSLEADRVSYEDMRLALAEDVMKKVISAISERKELIVIDSWDTVAKEMERVERLKTEKFIASMLDSSSDSRCIFVSEEPGLTSTDYLVDAIVSLDFVQFQGRRFREIVWEKLRGQPIEEDRQLYTLHGGRFSLVDMNRYRSTAPSRFEAIPDTNPNYLSTGSKDLDQFFGGGLYRGSFILLETGPTVGNHWHAPIFDMMVCNTLLNGGTCFALPSPPVTPQMILRSIGSHVDEELIKARMRISTYVKPSIHHQSMIDLSAKSPEQVYQMQQKAIIDLKVANGNAPTLWFMSMDTYEAFGGSRPSDNASFIARGTAALRQNRDVLVMLAKPSTNALQLLSDNCDMHLMLEEVDGSLVLYAKRPPTEPHAVSCDFSKGFPSIGLTKLM